MNAENNKFDYGTLLAPPEGYKLNKAVGTTYSLDLKTLLSIPISFHFGVSHDKELIKDPFSLFLSLKNTASKIDVFCQHGGIAANVKPHRLYRFIEPCINAIDPPMGKSFHPKVWIIRYEHEKNHDALYKVIILSRNLTFDKSWDMIICMEGAVPESGTLADKKVNQPLVDFIEYIYNQKNKKISKSFLDDLLKVNFRPTSDDPFSKLQMIPVGLKEKYFSFPFLKKNSGEYWQEILAISPFVSIGVIDALKSNCQKLTLISRPESLSKLSREVVDNINCYHINKKIINGSAYNTEEDNEGEGMSPISEQYMPEFYDLHAKVYLLKRGSEFQLYIGSANATESAFNGNVEFVVALLGERKNSIQFFLDTFFNDSKDFLERFAFDPETAINNEEGIVEMVLENLLSDLLRQTEKIEVSANYVGNKMYNLEIQSKIKLVIDADYEIFIRPFHLHIAHDKRVSGATEQFLFSDILIEDLSEFFVLTVKNHSKNLMRQCIIKLTVLDMPQEREEWIVRSLFRDKNQFFKLLRMILSDDIIDAMIGALDDNGNGHAKWKFSGCNEPPVFERLLKAASRNPSKLNEISQVIGCFSNSINKNEELDDEIVAFIKLFKYFDASVTNSN